jgi:signal transduction histidine kinase
MRSPKTRVEAEAVARQVHARLKLFVLVLVNVTHLLLVFSIWGDWRRIGIVTGVFGVVSAFNVALARRYALNATRDVESLRVGLNLLAVAVYGHFSAWAFPVWLYLPLNSLWVGSSVDKWARVRLYVLLSVVVGLALLDGCAPVVPLTMLVISVLIASISEARLQLTRLALDSLAQRHQELERALAELDVAHRRAREQERLSSLGLLAAGIAHEINNPMSYVKSNLHLLQRDLQEQKELPAALREYVTEVIPETLDGVKRVCSIVADLRRFARGDPEAWIEYDLNEEVQAALRLTRGRLQARSDVEVEVDLGQLQRMLGHPRQISQVVVNLLVNAAQALEGRGKVVVSTRPDGEDDVVLTVRDTGTGMTPDVLAHLFQPFFTTKPEGEGTGLGLSVVHGIVSSHGGRIQVESEPGQGTTFSIRLPRVPPLKFIASPRGEDAPASAGPSATRDVQGPSRLTERASLA